MKIDTRKCTPIKGSPDSVMVHPNKFLLDGDGSKLLPPTADHEGRERKYIPTITYTPVLTSTRLESRQRLISYDDIQELNKKLEDLFLSDPKNDRSTEDESTTKDNTSSKEKTSKSEKGDDRDEKKETVEESFLGRFYKSVFSYRTNKSYEVTRSARLA